MMEDSIELRFVEDNLEMVVLDFWILTRLMECTRKKSDTEEETDVVFKLFYLFISLFFLKKNKYLVIEFFKLLKFQTKGIN